jgi:pyruvate formate-lyase activating enzyme-like uncharacterized protein
MRMTTGGEQVARGEGRTAQIGDSLGYHYEYRGMDEKKEKEVKIGCESAEIPSLRLEEEAGRATGADRGTDFPMKDEIEWNHKNLRKMKYRGIQAHREDKRCVQNADEMKAEVVTPVWRR